jgi:hypothetical protein
LATCANVGDTSRRPLPGAVEPEFLETAARARTPREDKVSGPTGQFANLNAQRC